MSPKAKDAIAIPVTAADALKMWDAGEPVPAIKVESEGQPQNVIYRAAFEMIRSGEVTIDSVCVGLEKREAIAAKSIAIVAMKKGWASMLNQHQHESIERITVTKPKG